MRPRNYTLKITSIILFCSIFSHQLKAQIIDFEPTAGFDPVEGMPLDNSYMINTYGVSFHLDNLGGTSPIMSKTGNPRTAFASATVSLGCGISPSLDDNVYDGGSGCFYVTDDGLLAPVTYDLVIDYLSADCCGSASGDLLDVDQGEAWAIEVYSPGILTPTATYTLCAGGSCDFPANGDGSRSSWTVDVSPNTIDYLKFIYNSVNGPIAVGIGFDNFEFCANNTNRVEVSETIELCTVDSFPIIWRGNTITEAGNYVDSNSLNDVCDTLFILNVTQDFIFNSTEITYSCEILDTAFNSIVYSSIHGCDSIHTIVTIPTPLDTISGLIPTCNTSLIGLDTSYVIQGEECDTIFIGSYFIQPLDTILATDSVCSVIDTITEVLNYTTIDGCDSIVVIQHPLSQNQSFTESIEYQCGISDTLVNSMIFISSLGCDSTHTLFTYPALLDTLQEVVFTCISALNGLDTMSLIQGVECDTVFLGTFVFQPSDSTFIVVPTCDMNTATEYMLFTASSGCDSIVVIEHPFIDTVIYTEAIELQCDIADTIVLETQFITASGCDSIHALITIPLRQDTVMRSTPTCDSALFGRDSVFILAGDLCDTILIVQYQFIPIDTTVLIEFLCGDISRDTSSTVTIGSSGCDSTIIRIRVFSQDTVYSESIEYSCMTLDSMTEVTTSITTSGCDSIHTHSIIPIPPAIQHITQVLCDSTMVGLDTIFSSTQLGCDSLTIIHSEFSHIWMNLARDTIIAPNQPVELLGTSNFIPTQITWIPPGPNDTKWLIHPSEESTYTLFLTDSLGCTVSSSVLIQLIEDGQIFIPNAFSPNNDGINDRWFVYHNNSIMIKKIEIFERWGNKVWESDTNSGWDGYFLGTPLNPNVFVAVITYCTFSSTQEIITTTDIQLIR